MCPKIPFRNSWLKQLPIFCRLKSFFSIIFIILLANNIELVGQTGIKAGINISNFYYTDIPPEPYKDYDIDLRPYLGYDIRTIQTGDQKPLFSPYLGFYYSFQISRQWILRPELAYTRKGVSFNQNEFEKIIYKVLINYLEIPVSFSYIVHENQDRITELYFGGYMAYSLRAVKKTAFHDASPEKTELTSVNNFDGGFHMGGNYHWKLSDNYPVFVDLRIVLGLTNIFSLPEDWTKMYFNTQETKITAIQLTAGYEF
jgi:hypothetical protein